MSIKKLLLIIQCQIVWSERKMPTCGKKCLCHFFVYCNFVWIDHVRHCWQLTRFVPGSKKDLIFKRWRPGCSVFKFNFSVELLFVKVEKGQIQFLLLHIEFSIYEKVDTTITFFKTNLAEPPVDIIKLSATFTNLKLCSNMQ